jgi:hypothetical protein
MINLPNSPVQQLVPQPAVGAPLSNNQPGATPVTPNFVPPVQAPIPTETLSKWASIASIGFGSSSPGSSAALTALGDHLTAQGWTEAAHCW